MTPKTGSIAIEARPVTPRHTTRRSRAVQGRWASIRARLSKWRNLTLLLFPIAAAFPVSIALPVSVPAHEELQAIFRHSPIREVQELQIGDKVPQTQLVDQTGTPFTFSKFLGQNVVLAFIYTRCRDPRECPLTTSKFEQLQQQLGSGSERGTHLIEVTLDPQYDTPAVLAKYARLYQADPQRWTFGTGTVDTTTGRTTSAGVNDVLNFDAVFGLDPLADPSIGIIHGETLAIVDRSGTIRDLIYTNSWQPSEIIAELNGFDNKTSNPIARLDLWLSRAAVAVCGNGVAGFSGFTDLLVVLAIFAACGWLFWRLYRWIASSPT